MVDPEDQDQDRSLSHRGHTNSSKTKVMICTPGFIRTAVTQESYQHLRDQSQGASFQARRRRRTSCPECGKEYAVGSLRIHMRTQHGMDLPPEPMDSEQELVCTLAFPRIKYGTPVPCPYPGCPGSGSNPTLMRRHFNHRHPRSTLHMNGGPPPQPCDV